MTPSHRSARDGFTITGHGAVVSRRAPMRRPVGWLVLSAVPLVAGSVVAFGVAATSTERQPFPPVGALHVELKIVERGGPDERGSRRSAASESLRSATRPTRRRRAAPAPVVAGAGSVPRFDRPHRSAPRDPRPAAPSGPGEFF